MSDIIKTADTNPESKNLHILEKELQEFRTKTLSDISWMDKAQLMEYLKINDEKIQEFTNKINKFYRLCNFKPPSGNSFSVIANEDITVEQLKQQLLMSIDYKNQTEQKEIMKKENEKNEIKLKIIENIVQLKAKIQDYKKLSKNQQWKEKDGIIGELQIVKKLFEEIIGTAKTYLSNTQSIADVSQIDMGKEIWEKILSKIDRVDSEVLSISLLQKLFNLRWFQNFGEIQAYLSDGKNQDENVRLNMLKSMNVEDLDRTTLETNLKKYWDISYEANEWASTWPILIIFPEMHYAGAILKNNTEAILESASYYNFIATEWGGGEMRSEYMEISKRSKEEIMKMIGENDIWISSDAIEAILKEAIKTIGVEPEDFTPIRQKLTRGKTEDEKKSTIDNMNKQSEWLTYKQYFENSKNNSNEFFKNVIVTYRNYFWLQNIQKELISWKQQGEMRGKNFVPIILGGAHADDLVSQSKSMWFKGVIRFSPKVLDEKVDPKVAEAYVRGQM